MRIRSLVDVGIELEVIVAEIGGVLEAALKEASVASSQAVLNEERDIEKRIYYSSLRVRKSSDNNYLKSTLNTERKALSSADTSERGQWDN